MIEFMPSHPVSPARIEIRGLPKASNLWPMLFIYIKLGDLRINRQFIRLVYSLSVRPTKIRTHCMDVLAQKRRCW